MASMDRVERAVVPIISRSRRSSSIERCLGMGHVDDDGECFLRNKHDGVVMLMFGVVLCARSRCQQYPNQRYKCRLKSPNFNQELEDSLET